MRAWSRAFALSCEIFAFAFWEAWCHPVQISTQMPPRSKQISLMSCFVFMSRFYWMFCELGNGWVCKIK